MAYIEPHACTCTDRQDVYTVVVPDIHVRIHAHVWASLAGVHTHRHVSAQSPHPHPAHTHNLFLSGLGTRSVPGGMCPVPFMC